MLTKYNITRKTMKFFLFPLLAVGVATQIGPVNAFVVPSTTARRHVSLFMGKKQDVHVECIIRPRTHSLSRIVLTSLSIFACFTSIIYRMGTGSHLENKRNKKKRCGQWIRYVHLCHTYCSSWNFSRLQSWWPICSGQKGRRYEAPVLGNSVAPIGDWKFLFWFLD